MDNNYGQYGGQIPPVQPVPPPYYDLSGYVDPEEKKRIRKNYNSIGITLLSDYILGNGLFYAAIITLSLFFGYETVSDENGTMIFGAVEIVLSTWILAFAGMIVFVGYCIFTGYDPKELFSVKGIKAGELTKYILLVLGLQKASLICTIFVSMFLNSFGLEVTAFDYVMAHDPQTYAADFISSIILAPIAEELIFRGVVLRCSAKISGRFAIFFSALMFGLMHGNPYQFVLAFLIGIPLAMIAMKTGSIIPSIICHMANNLLVEAYSIMEYFDEDLAYALNLLSIPVFIIIGIIVLVIMIRKGEMKLPPYTERHKKRTLPIVITSWSIILVTVFYIIDTIQSLGPIDSSVQETVTEAARRFLI